MANSKKAPATDRERETIRLGELVNWYHQVHINILIKSIKSWLTMHKWHAKMKIETGEQLNKRKNRKHKKNTDETKKKKYHKFAYTK